MKPKRHATFPLEFGVRSYVLLGVGLGLLSVGALPALTRAAPPQEGDCPKISPTLSDGRLDPDATPFLVKEGMRVNKQGVLALQSLLPEEIWRYRETFFFEGMLMEIGPCHRRYAAPSFYTEATRKNQGDASLDEQGNLENYRAGIPFPQETLSPQDPLVGVKWAWNLEKRFRGAGHQGRFRITHFPSSIGGIGRFEGDFFTYQVAGRSDLPESNYHDPANEKMLWATGGQFNKPFGARELAWRQFRKAKSSRRWNEADDIFVYVPNLRKMRRAGTHWVDGAFVPRFSIAGQVQGGGGMAVSGGSSSISPGAGASLAVSEDARAGLTGMFLRPNAYVWRWLGEKTVLAPLNGTASGWPIQDQRNYGYSGLSVASDRWDVRQAVVIEGALRQKNETIRTLTIYLDYETLQPLYWITRTDRRRLVEVGIFVHRFTGDVPGSAEWPDGTPSLVFEPVAAAFFNALEGRGGWLRESYDLSSLPVTPSQALRMTTSSALQRGH